ncbi:META domain-containing protein [Flagellimonas sp.]|uniref:META domain-containing protein n=1 Tax=Flagellimonas sp. TaxID=2058762 RepID=UPI003B5C16AB
MPTRFKLLATGIIISLLVIGCSEDAERKIEGDIVGKWQVNAIHNSSPSGPTLGPTSGEVISITFDDNGKFTGATSVNSFKGSYSATETILLIREITTTEVADTNFGQAFYESISESRNTTTGFSEFAIDFKDENNLNLEYLGFKFLTLQKEQ